jgi:hypothetical protein
VPATAAITEPIEFVLRSDDAMLEIAKEVVVALVDVALTAIKFVIVDDALLMSIPSVVESGCRYVPWSDQLVEPEPIHVPLIEKQPDVILSPTFEVLVAEPEMVRPESVVVPNPRPETEKKLVPDEFCT